MSVCCLIMFIKKQCNWETVQYFVQLIAHVTVNNYSVCYFLMLLLHVLASTGHLQGGHLSPVGAASQSNK
jgi:hypothetical protein